MGGTMRIGYFSDAHLEHRVPGSVKLKRPDCDVLVIAGDLFNMDNEQWMDWLSDLHPRIVLVKGNHEYYGSSIYDKAKYPDNVTLLTDNSKLIDGISFFGGTMWSNPKNDILIETNINDFFVIETKKGVRFTVEKMKQLHKNFLEKLINANPDVVVTHFPPSLKSVDPRFSGSMFNDYFCNDLDSVVQWVRPKIWIHGHVHHKVSYEIQETTVLCNPWGYPGELKNFGKILFTNI